MDGTGAAATIPAAAAASAMPVAEAAVETSHTGRPGVLLIHGLGGTQYDMGSMHKRLKTAGFETHSLTLPGHGTTPEDLMKVGATDWLDACRALYRDLAARYETLHVMGMCMGALLAVETAKQEKHAKGNLVALAPPIYIDGWSTPWYRDLRPAFYWIPPLQSMRIEEEEPFGIKNEQLRAVVKAKFERGENFHYQWVPLACIRQVDALRQRVMTGLDKIRCQTLVIHARHDELTSLRSADYLVRNIGGDRARMVALENSYHMICVDNDREIVARNVLEFFGVPSVAGGQLSDEPRMAGVALASLVAQVQAVLGSTDWHALAAMGIPDLAWYHPGANRLSGIHRGAKPLREFLGRIGTGCDSARLTAFGTPVFNRGVALMPAVWSAVRGSERLQSQGALMVAMHADRLHEVRWFADDPELEDAFWGPALPEDDAQASATAGIEARFEAATGRSRALKATPSEAKLLEMYALYKQSAEGDARGDRPGVLDVVGRAKFDAWAKLAGTGRHDAMERYCKLIESLEKDGVT